MILVLLELRSQKRGISKPDTQKWYENLTKGLFIYSFFLFVCLFFRSFVYLFIYLLILFYFILFFAVDMVMRIA